MFRERLGTGLLAIGERASMGKVKAQKRKTTSTASAAAGKKAAPSRPSSTASAAGGKPERRTRLTFDRQAIDRFDKELDRIEKPVPMRRESDEVTVAGIVAAKKDKIVAKLRSGVTIQQLHAALEKSTGREIPFDLFKRQISALKVIRSGLPLVYPASPQKRFTDESPERRVAVRSSGRTVRTNTNMPSLTTERPDAEHGKETVTARR